MTGANDPDRGDAEVGERLRRLFDDAALGVVAVPDPDAVVAGARRRRRRRATAGACAGVVVTLGAVAGGLVLSGAGGAPGPGDIAAADSSGPITRSTDVSVPRDTSRAADEAPPPGLTTVESPPGAAPTSMPRTAPPNRSAPPSMRPSSATSIVADLPEGPPLGASGQEPLTLLMSYDEAVATGAMDPGDGPPAQGRCRTYEVSGPGVLRVAIRGGHGIVRFQAADAPTPERVGVGSPVADLNRAYPESEPRGERHRVQPNPDADSQYLFGVDGDRVTTLRLTVPDPEVSC